MKLQQFNPILYLEEYEDMPEDFCRWKRDEELLSGWSSNWEENGEEYLQRVPEKLCVGIGKYHTDMDGDLFFQIYSPWEGASREKRKYCFLYLAGCNKLVVRRYHSL